LQTANKPELHDKYIKMQEMFFSNTLVASTVIFIEVISGKDSPRANDTIG